MLGWPVQTNGTFCNILKLRKYFIFIVRATKSLKKRYFREMCYTVLASNRIISEIMYSPPVIMEK